MYVHNVMTHMYWLTILIAIVEKLTTAQWAHCQENFRTDNHSAKRLKDKDVQYLQKMLVTVKSVNQIISILMEFVLNS